MEYKKAKLFGKEEDGFYQGRVEDIGTGRPLKILGKTVIKESGDVLYISNRHDPAWIFSLLTGYRQIGVFPIKKGHKFKEGQDVIVEKKNDKIISIKEAD